ncbi:MAG: CRTAC1 family protein, partial [Pricia sp.]|nr:CRTAC1 family protein [Pricia sp.]
NTGVAVVDINADGWMDLYVCSAMNTATDKRANLLFINKGLNANGVPEFEEAAAKFGIAETGNSMAATFFDYDKDGFLDLYVLNNEQNHILPTNYRKKITDGSAVSNDRLYHNNGDNTFTDVTVKAGINIEGFGLGVAVADLNYDTWPDLYVSNDYLTNDLLYINNGDGTFSNTIENNIKHQSKFSMGSDISDYNNDGFLDIITLDMLGETNQRMKTTISNTNYINYVLNERWDYEYQYMRNMLHLGNGPDVPYSEIGLMAGIPKTDWSWSPLFVDMDNDGYRDLLITNGFPRDITDMDFANFRLEISRYVSPAKILDSIPVVKIPNYAYRNKGDLTFEDVSKTWGLDIPSFSNGAAFTDLDMDGDLDYVVNNINDEAFIFENTLKTKNNGHNYLKIDLNGPRNNPQGIGTKIVVRFDDEKLLYYEHHLTRGYMSSVESIVHFGLGARENNMVVEILWPDGNFEKIQKVKGNQVLDIAYEDSKAVSVDELHSPFSLKKSKQLFSEVSKLKGIDFVHQEQDIVDYNVQSILPHKLTQN